jgi:hypothetical protein
MPISTDIYQQRHYTKYLLQCGNQHTPLGFENMRANVGVRISNGALHDRVHTRWQVED